MQVPVSRADIAHVLTRTESLWPALRGKTILITGATGFFGKWLLESLAAANRELDADIRAILLSRDPAGFANHHPHLATAPGFTWLAGNSASVHFPTGTIDLLIDLATPSAQEVGAGDTALVAATLASTTRLADFARHAGVQRVLYASSGAVYGHSSIIYADLKKRSELIWLESGTDCVIARGFAFIGPYLPLTDKFAAGAFLRDALAGGPVRVSGDGSPVRSYLYAADLAIWLLTLLIKGVPSTAYDVGSDHAISVGELAREIARAGGSLKVTTGTPNGGAPASHYVPDITPARSSLGLDVFIDRAEAIGRTLAWARRDPEIAGRGQVANR